VNVHTLAVNLIYRGTPTGRCVMKVTVSLRLANCNCRPVFRPPRPAAALAHAWKLQEQQKQQQQLSAEQNDKKLYLWYPRRSREKFLDLVFSWPFFFNYSWFTAPLRFSWALSLAF